jgi:hypothetical protein
MIKPVLYGDKGLRQPYTPKIGDILWEGREYLVLYTNKDLELFQPMMLEQMHYNPWNTLVDLGIDFFDIRKKSEYECPITNRKYNGIVPVVLLSTDLKKYFNKNERHDSQYLCDDEFHRSFTFKEGIPLSDVVGCLLGPGYTDCNLPSDGHGRIIDLKIPLDNGDFVVCKVWEWYNK